MTLEKDLLIVAGFDPSGGAGVLKDISTVYKFSLSYDTLISSLTVQNASSFESFHTPNLDYFKKSLALFKNNKYKGLKFGLITDIEIAKLFYNDFILSNAWKNIKIKVLDPVLKASVAKSLFWNDELFDFMLKYIIPNFDIITPNKKEAELFADRLKINFDTDENLVKVLSENLGVSVLMTGGDENEVIDYIYSLENSILYTRKGTKINAANRHGTGCLFSTALTSFMLKKESLFDAGVKSAEKVEKYLYTNLV